MKETSDDLIALHVRLLDIAEKHFPQLVNMILVRGVRSIEANGSRTSVIVYEPPYDGVFVTLCHHVKTYVSESTNSVWSGTLPYDGSLPAADAVCEEMFGWMHALRAEVDLRDKKEVRVDINDPKLRYTVRRGE